MNSTASGALWGGAVLITLTAGVAQAQTVSAAAPAAKTPLAPLPIEVAPDDPKLTCADFSKSIVDGGWAATRVIKLPGLTLYAGKRLASGPIAGVDLVAVLQRRCAAVRTPD
jgi:hypothetical protein